MSVEEKERAIRSFEFYLSLVNTDFGVDPEQIRDVRLKLSQLVGYFPNLRYTEEYKEINYVFEDLKSSVTRFFSGKSKVEDLAKYGGELIAKAYEELARIKATQKPPEIKKEIVPIPIPPSPWYKIVSDVDELSDAMWEDDFKIRNILPMFEKLIGELKGLGNPENFCGDLINFYTKLSNATGNLTIPELKKLNPSYMSEDEELRKLITRIKKYARRIAEEK